MTNPLIDRRHEAMDDLPARLPGGAGVRAAAIARKQRRRVLGGTALAVAIAFVAVTAAVGERTVGDRLLATDAPSSPPNASPPAVLSPAGTPSSPTMPSQARSLSKDPLAGFHFQEEATWKPIPNEVTVTRTDDVRTAWALDPCTPTAYPTDRQRVAMASLVMSGPEAGDVRQLAVYADAATAAEVMAGFRRVLAACASPAGSTGTYVTARTSVADEGLVVAHSIFYQSGTQVPGGGYYVLVRDGRSVYLAVIGREFQPKGPTDAAATELVAAARGQLPLPQ